MAFTNLPPRKKIALDNRKLALSAPCPSAPGKFATLSWRLVSNNPRISVYTNDPADMTEKNGNGLIAAAMDAPVFFALMRLMYKIIDGPNGVKEKIENKNYIFPGGKRSEKPVVVSEIIVGKDDEGVVFISVVAYDKSRPRIKFELLPNEFHCLYHQNGQQFTKAEASEIYARGYMQCVEGLMTHLLVTEWVEPEKKENNGNNRGGNRNGGNNSQRSQSSNDGGNDFSGGDDLLF